MKIMAVIGCLLILLLQGCSGIKPYNTSLPDNLDIQAKTDSVKATLDIYDVNDRCQTIYLGTVNLNSEKVVTGIPSGKPTYLVLGFSNSSFLSGSRSRMNYDILVNTKGGYRYELDVSYLDNIYNVELFEINKKTGEKHSFKNKGIPGCKAS